MMNLPKFRLTQTGYALKNNKSPGPYQIRKCDLLLDSNITSKCLPLIYQMSLRNSVLPYQSIPYRPIFSLTIDIIHNTLRVWKLIHGKETPKGMQRGTVSLETQVGHHWYKPWNYQLDLQLPNLQEPERCIEKNPVLRTSGLFWCPTRVRPGADAFLDLHKRPAPGCVIQCKSICWWHTALLWSQL